MCCDLEARIVSLTRFFPMSWRVDADEAICFLKCASAWLVFGSAAFDICLEVLLTVDWNCCDMISFASRYIVIWCVVIYDVLDCLATSEAATCARSSVALFLLYGNAKDLLGFP